MSAAPNRQYSVAEYLAFERGSALRHEYVNGDIFAMTEASKEHGQIVRNMGTQLMQAVLERPCKFFVETMRVRIHPTLYLYPDGVVVCAPAQFADAAGDTLLNPTLVVDVLPPSSFDDDEDFHVEEYLAIDSLQEYLMIVQDRPLVQHYQRQDVNRWLMTRYRTLDSTLELMSVGCTLALSTVYAAVTFDPT
jgi:Uma2 family endonuclease